MTTEPTHWLNYRGDRRTMRNAVGPTTDGHTLLPIEAQYDEEADRTRVGFATLAALRAAELERLVDDEDDERPPKMGTTHSPRMPSYTGDGTAIQDVELP